MGLALIVVGVSTRAFLNFYKKVRSKEHMTMDKAYKLFAGGFHKTMNDREARLILNVTEGSTTEQIREKHRRLMMLNHPDNGGSNYLATKINEAKEKLMT